MRAHKIPASGRISRGITPNTLLSQTIAFVERQLPSWRDDNTRKFVEAEEDLNGQLCKFLNDRAREEFPMAMFHHEERQETRRRVDLSVIPTRKAIDAAIYGSIYEPFLVMEGKRLPAPTVQRQQEYITGLDEKSGGVQRFRLCLHGKAHSAAVLIGYVQRGQVRDWRNTINNWINALNTSGEDTTCEWTKKDALGKLTNTGKKRASRCESNHNRSGGAADIRLIHLWICMRSKAVRKEST